MRRKALGEITVIAGSRVVSLHRILSARVACEDVVAVFHTRFVTREAGSVLRFVGRLTVDETPEAPTPEAG